MAKKVSRRDFARTSMAAGAAAAAAFPGALLNETAPVKGANGNGKRAVAKQSQAAAAANGSSSTDGRWRDGYTIPAEYYVDEKRYLEDERYIADRFWLLADHESRIAKPGDYFTFAFGRGESVIVLRDKAM